jgi:CRP/FNR family cyclic AMP-dependent transcriptional regulator
VSVPAHRSALPQLKAFQGFTPAELDAIAKVLKPERVAAGGVLFREGDKASCCYIVVEGRVRVSLERGSKPKQLAMLGRGELIGQMALLDGSRRSATCTAAEPSLVLKLDRDELELLFRSGASFALKFIDSLTRMLVAQLRFATRQLATMNDQPAPAAAPAGTRRSTTDLRRDLIEVARGTLDCTVDGCGVDDVELVVPEK